MIIPLSELDFLKRALIAHAEEEAVVCGDIRLTYRQFGDRINSWANAIRALDVKKSDRVALLFQNCHRVLEGFFGAPLLGAILMPLNFRLVPDDFEYILNHGGASVVIIEEELAPLIEPIRKNLRTIEHFIAANDIGEVSTDGWQDYESLLAGASNEPPTPAEIDENETSALLYTS